MTRDQEMTSKESAHDREELRTSRSCCWYLFEHSPGMMAWPPTSWEAGDPRGHQGCSRGSRALSRRPKEQHRCLLASEGSPHRDWLLQRGKMVAMKNRHDATQPRIVGSCPGVALRPPMRLVAAAHEG